MKLGPWNNFQLQWPFHKFILVDGEQQRSAADSPLSDVQNISAIKMLQAGHV
jgi:hypothetical protein